MSRDFVWRDVDRTVVMRRGALAGAADLLREHGIGEAFERGCWWRLGVGG